MEQQHVTPTFFKSNCLAYLDFVTSKLKKRLNLKIGNEFRTFGTGIGANDIATFRFPDDEFNNTNILIRRSQDSESLIFIGPTHNSGRVGKRLKIPADTYFEILGERGEILASGRAVRITDLIRSHEFFISNGRHSPNVKNGAVVCRLSYGILKIQETENGFVSSFSGGYEKGGTSPSDSLLNLGFYLDSIGKKKMFNDMMEVHETMLEEISFLLKQEWDRNRKNQIRRQKRALSGGAE